MSKKNDKSKSATVDTVKPLVMLKCTQCGKDVHPKVALSFPIASGKPKLCRSCFECAVFADITKMLKS